MTPRKHLHGRGEDINAHCVHEADEETPPRTWRRRNPGIGIDASRGNTSTDVEKT